MADYTSDQPASTQPHTQRTTAAGQHKRNNRNRRNNQGLAEGAVSDGAIVDPASPRSRKAHRQCAALGPEQPNMGRGNAQRQRPMSTGGGLIPATPAKEQAYAGPTFQASPAAASLPKPKFFSKSVPNAVQHTTLQARLEREKDSHTLESSPESDSAAPAPTPPPRDESPLDFFFKADRAEKAKSRSNSNALSPQPAAKSLQPATVPRNTFQGKSVFLQELDGDNEDMPSPRTVLPKSRPGPGDRSHSSPGAQEHTISEVNRQAYTKNLKELLFSTAAQSVTPPQLQSRPNTGARTPDGVFGSPSPKNQYSLHYGNRNLSPLFTAARGDSPARPSSLRQEMFSDSPSKAHALGNYQMYQPIPAPNDTNTFARSYLKEQVRTSAPAEMPQLSFGVQPVGPSHGTAGSVPASSTPRSGGSHDIQGMENDLRRMLKLNVLG
ncbi:hypothetical protein DOTSEDRAFT_80876 [Dothistroma septosporum NZE10]|uniref:Proteophosphoglycan 5 n=1 Tax=Dothistroma septosporum (strain NZE10 / CBS 128990) TaxID=675120 RepID=M2Y5J7_DOTSN|nr:hypothetical protein DOTSEDRAFT_80876 [Dothistroma septosporum NZE10]